MDKKKFYALLIAAAMITATTTTPNPLAPTTHRANTPPTRSPAAPPPQAEWNKTYGGTEEDWASSAEQTSDGGYIVAGSTSSFGAGEWDFWLVKTDASGNMQWNKTYGGTGLDLASSVQQTSDGGYIVAGGTRSFGTRDSDLWLVKTDGSGNQQWNITYGGTDADEANSVQQTSDGGYIVAGSTSSFGAGGWELWLVKTDASGNIQWNTTTQEGGPTYHASVQQTFDGGYIAAGNSLTFSPDFAPLGEVDFLLVKTDGSGNQQWNRTYGGLPNDYSSSVQQTSDDGYIVAGTTVLSSYNSNFLLVKADSGGNMQWNRTYGGYGVDLACSARQASDDGYIVAGITESVGGGGNCDFWLVKTDASGNMQWNKTYGGAGRERLSSIPTSDGGFIVAGTKESFLGSYDWDFWLVKMQDGTPPLAIHDIAAGSLTSSSVMLTWSATGDNGARGNSTGYVIKYSTVGPITDANWSSAAIYTQSWTPVKNGTTEKRVVANLSPGTKYWFAVEAYDDVTPTPNYGAISNSPSVTTLQENPAVIIVGAVAVAAIVVVLVATVVLMKKGRGPTQTK